MSDTPEFRVAWSQEAIRTIKEFAQRAPLVETRQRLAEVLRALDGRLSRDPLAVGEAYRSTGNIVEQYAALTLLGIEFAVDTDRKFVFVRRCCFLEVRNP
jgi:hypothetical protein